MLDLYAKLNIAFDYAIIFAATLPRIVAICLYLRIFVEKPYRRLCYTLLTVVVTYSSLAIVLTSIVRIPLKSLWDPQVASVCCINPIAWWRWSTLPGAIIDVIMILLPIPVILKLRLPKRDKIGLFLTFATGSM